MADLQCLGQHQLYSDGQPCMGTLHTLKEFWSWHPSGNNDAYLCLKHARAFAGRGRGYLAERSNYVLLHQSDSLGTEEGNRG